MAQAKDEVRSRLLDAWRGEIEAGAVYELIANRMPDREADILRRMAAAEGKHRERLEQRMQQLGIAIPDPAAVRPSLWPAEEKANPAITPFINELKYAVGRTTVLGANFATYSTDLNTALIQVLEGQKTAPDALKKAAAAANPAPRTCRRGLGALLSTEALGRRAGAHRVDLGHGRHHRLQGLALHPGEHVAVIEEHRP